jgi:putative peptidoglycan lipid II flippase
MRIRSIFSNSAGILLSRIFGFIRDLMMASVLGANIYSDIFFVAFKLPNLFRRIFGEGAFAQSFLPSFIASRYKSIFSAKILLNFVLVISLIIILVGFYSQEITKVIAPGFNAQIVALSARFVEIQFWYLLLIFIVTFFGTLLQYKEHFATTAFATVLLNISLITALFISKGSSKEEILYTLSWAVIFGGILQVIAHLIVGRYFGILKMLRVGFLSLRRHSKKVKKDTNRFFKNFLPAVWGNSTAQIMAFLDTWLASFLVSGSISYLYYANRIFQLPLALFAIAVSVAIFPSISKLINQNQEQKAHEELKKGFWILIFLLGLSALGGIIFSKEIIWLLFERGAFSRADTISTANVLMAYLVGLLPFGLSKLFSLWLYAHHKQLEAAKIATWSLIGYGVSASVLFFTLGVVGLAISSTISGFISFIFLIKAFGWEDFRSLFDKKMIIIFVSTLALAGVIFFTLHIFIVELMIIN